MILGMFILFGLIVLVSWKTGDGKIAFAWAGIAAVLTALDVFDHGFRIDREVPFGVALIVGLLFLGWYYERARQKPVNVGTPGTPLRSDTSE